MSKRYRKMLNAAINTDALTLDVDPNDVVKSTRLKERDVKHIRITHTSELQETYSFGDQIGQGGFGTVVSVVDKHTDKEWAMKIVGKTALGNKLETVYREIKILKMVDHPHIIYLHKVYESARKIYLILELCYSALSTIYKEQKLFSEKDARKIIRDLASAIAYLHKNDIVHRDLKLDNILIAKNPDDVEDKLYIKVSDFGLGIIKQGSGYENMLHDCCGTPIYMAPEIITTNSYSQQCDVWAIGVIMYTMLSGHYPFYSANEQELTTMICKTEPSYSDFSASTEAIHLITKLLSKNPAQRITAGELIIHPWITGKRMMYDSNSPENVLDMMRLWRSEMMLPAGADCDWVSSAKAIGSSTAIPSRQNSSASINSNKIPHIISEISEDSTGILGTKARKQSMRLPITNICFEKLTNQNAGTRGTSRRSSIAGGVEEPRTYRRGSTSPPPSTPTSRRSSYIPKRTATHALSDGSKLQISKTPDKGKKTSKRY